MHFTYGKQLNFQTYGGNIKRKKVSDVKFGISAPIPLEIKKIYKKSV